MIRLEISKSSCGVGLKFQDGNATNSLNSIKLRTNMYNYTNYDIVGYTWNFKMKQLRFWNFKSNSLNWIFSSTDDFTAALMRARNVIVAGKEWQSLQVKAAKLLANTDDNDNDEEGLVSLEEAWCIILIVGIDVLTVIVLFDQIIFTFRQESQHYWLFIRH